MNLVNNNLHRFDNPTYTMIVPNDLQVLPGAYFEILNGSGAVVSTVSGVIIISGQSVSMTYSGCLNSVLFPVTNPSDSCFGKTSQVRAIIKTKVKEPSPLTCAIKDIPLVSSFSIPRMSNALTNTDANITTLAVAVTGSDISLLKIKPKI